MGKEIWDVFDTSLIELGRLAIDRNRFRRAVKGMQRPVGIVAVRVSAKTFIQKQLITLSHKITAQ